MPGFHRFLKKKVLNQYSEYSSGLEYIRILNMPGFHKVLDNLIGC